MTLRSWLSAAGLALVVSGCADAWVQLDWTERTSTGALSSCSAMGATQLHAVLTDDGGNVARDARVPCERGELTLGVGAGWYGATLTLEDDAETPIASTKLSPFYVGEGDVNVQVVTFPVAPAAQ